ncbi:MAG TPA: hypothetical protein DCR93_34440 [Cytophagales bacterium]|nr:hypothetical protein [Cytophagales bacterium]HAP64370.1 hypothetical protein [Cytophagales bacterium]
MEAFQELIDAQLCDADVLLIIPPFYQIEFIALGPYTLKALAKEQGFSVEILHCEMLLAAYMGKEAYRKVCHRTPERYYQFIAERLFARSAFGLPPLGKETDSLHHADAALSSLRGDLSHDAYWEHGLQFFNVEELLALEAKCYQFVKLIAEAVANYSFKAIGFSIAFESQVHASVAMAQELKKKGVAVPIIAGGGYCNHGIEEGLAALGHQLDHIFAGEAEYSFLHFLENLGQPNTSFPRVIESERPYPLDALPMVDYEEYQAKVVSILGADFFARYIKLFWYETNRGCWWGDLIKCTFCSIPDVAFRSKSVKKIARELQEVKAKFPDKVILFADDILIKDFVEEYYPYTQNTHLPQIGFMEKIANDLEAVFKLKAINTRWILPGIETFSTTLLKRMRKGTMGKYNLYFLRNLACLQIECQWNLLYNFPGDTVAEYRYLMDLIPKITHLKNPTTLTNTLIGRGSPLYEQASKFGLDHLKPWRVYHSLFPDDAPVDMLANYFMAEWKGQRNAEMEATIGTIRGLVADWKANHAQAELALVQHTEDFFLIKDARKFNNYQAELTRIDLTQCLAYTDFTRYNPGDQWQEEALAKGYGVILDDWYVPLLTAPLPVLQQLEQARSCTVKTENTEMAGY